MQAEITKDSPEALAARQGIDLAHELDRGFAGRLIRRKARQILGKAKLSDTDREDIEQTLRVSLICRLSHFDPSRSHWQAFVLAVIDRQVATLLRALRSKRRRHSGLVISLNTPVAADDGLTAELGDLILPRHQQFIVGGPINDHQSAFALQEDLALVLKRLPPDLQKLCKLRQTKTVSEIARHLGVPRSTVDDAFSRIAQAFRDADLENYLAGDP
jgi:RNA polymerase sigma-70 factor, ECF subfamily